MRASTFISYVLFFFFAMFAVASALPSPLAEETDELLARSNNDGTPAEKGLTGGGTNDNDRKKAGIAAVVAGTAALTGTAAIKTTGTSGNAARTDTPAAGSIKCNLDASVAWYR
ncbi:hypothetical protein CTheo_7244 [Ceratobasidium theobromae]|uniref:Effector protein n=1 Tax=Ceratobasidium theobromae TaxID=1582974 RepID=A0A5N5QC07_9AGAM|nr:hypothetical protein CTheo_7244 [Ceratobasidium theobromae]